MPICQKKDLLAFSDVYQNLSYGILTECFNDDPKKTMALLTRRLKSWGNLTCLQIAIDTEDIVSLFAS